MFKPKNLIAKTYKKYTKIAQNMIKPYEETYGYLCDLYFPIHVPRKYGHGYQRVNLYEPHELPEYKDTPDVCNVLFYIPQLLKEESMNSISQEFDNFALTAAGEINRPFIETHPDKELPICTKVVIHLEESKLFYFVDVKRVVNGAGGHMLMRMYLSPLTKDTTIQEGKYEGVIPGTEGTYNGNNDRLDGAQGGYI